MADQINFQEEFQLSRKYNNRNDPIHVTRFLNLMYEFMLQVRRNAFQDASGTVLMDTFCDLADDDEIWNLLTGRVWEFRKSWVEYEDKLHKDMCLAYVLTRLRHRLPPPRLDNQAIKTDLDLVRQRLRLSIEFLATGGNTKRRATRDERTDIESYTEVMEGTFRNVPPRSPRQVASQSGQFGRPPSPTTPEPPRKKLKTNLVAAAAVDKSES
ncbi:MAG: hypothetical protein Q9218_002261 [Villophora microphyllina]